MRRAPTRHLCYILDKVTFQAEKELSAGPNNAFFNAKTCSQNRLFRATSFVLVCHHAQRYNISEEEP